MRTTSGSGSLPGTFDGRSLIHPTHKSATLQQRSWRACKNLPFDSGRFRRIQDGLRRGRLKVLSNARCESGSRSAATPTSARSPGWPENDERALTVDRFIRMYDPQSNTLGAYNADGTTRTPYKPDPTPHGYATNLDYWLAQPGFGP